MKLSIWQEFSSNNSSRFTIVGVFDDAAKAINAQKVVEKLFEDIQTWYDEDEERVEDILIDKMGISVPEEALAKKYSIDWKEPNGWYFNYRIAIQDNVLAISQHHGADSGAHPIDELLKKLGAQVAVDGDRVWFEDERFGTFEITCIAPSEGIARELLKTRKGTITQIEESDAVKLTLEPRHIDFSPIFGEREPKWFPLLRELVEKGCTDLQISVSDQQVINDEYDDLYQKYGR